MHKDAAKKFSNQANHKEPKMDKPGLFRRIGNWFKRVFTAEKAPVRRTLVRVKNVFRPAYNAVKKAYDYVVPPLVSFNRWMTIGIGASLYLISLFSNPIGTIALTLVISGAATMFALIHHTLETSNSDAAQTAAKVLGYVVRACGVACELVVGSICLAFVAAASLANIVWLLFSVTLYVVAWNDDVRRKARLAMAKKAVLEAQEDAPFRDAVSA